MQLPRVKRAKTQLCRKTFLRFLSGRERILPLSEKIARSIDYVVANGAAARPQIGGEISL